MKNNMTYSHDTNYAQKSFGQIIEYLKLFKKHADKSSRDIRDKMTQINRKYLQQYHQDLVIFFENAEELFQTASEEISIILEESKNGIKSGHIKRLATLGKEFSERNIAIGKIWNNNRVNNDYANQEFRKIERLYEMKDAIVALSELSDISHRLTDFVESPAFQTNPKRQSSEKILLKISKKEGIRRNNKNRNELPYRIKGGRYKAVNALRTLDRDINALKLFWPNSKDPKTDTMKHIASINKTFVKNLKVSNNIIIHNPTGGYSLNRNDFLIEFEE